MEFDQREHQQLEIDTLLASSSSLLERQTLFTAVPRILGAPFDQDAWPLLPNVSERFNENEVWDEAKIPSKSHEPSLPSEKQIDLPVKISKVVNGADIGDLPAQYHVQDIYEHEHAVIGTFVDRHIMTGFKYQIRPLETEKRLFQSRAMILQSIGIGYGKRLTFKGEKLNSNENYFYSDTQPDGYGFSLIAVEIGDTYDVCDDENRIIAVATVCSIDAPQTEIASKIMRRGEIEKHVAISMTCDIDYQAGPHGLLPLHSQDTVQVSGIAVIIKDRSKATATTQFIKDISLPNDIPCTFHQPHVPLQG